MEQNDLSKLTREQKIELIKKKQQAQNLSELSREEKIALIKEQRSNQDSADKAPGESPGIMDQIGSAVDIFAQGMIPFRPEVEAGIEKGIDTLTGQESDYNDLRNKISERVSKSKEELGPVAGTIAEVAGMAFPGAGIAKGAGLVAKEIGLASKFPKVAKILSGAAASGIESGVQTPLPEEGQKRSEQDIIDLPARQENALTGAAIGGGLSALGTIAGSMLGKGAAGKIVGPAGSAAENVSKFDKSNLGLTGSKISKIIKRKGQKHVDDILEYARNNGLADMSDKPELLGIVSTKKSSIGNDLQDIYEALSFVEKSKPKVIKSFNKVKVLQDVAKDLKGQDKQTREKVVSEIFKKLGPIKKDSTVNRLWEVRKVLDSGSKWRSDVPSEITEAYRTARSSLDDQIKNKIKDYQSIIQKSFPDASGEMLPHDKIMSLNKEYGILTTLEDAATGASGKSQIYKSLDLGTLKKNITDPAVIGTQRILEKPFTERMSSFLVKGGVPAISSKLSEGKAKMDTVEIPLDMSQELLIDIGSRSDIPVLERAKIKSKINSAIQNNQPVELSRERIQKLYKQKETPSELPFGLNSLRDLLQGGR